MFNDIWIAANSALSLARNLVVATMVIVFITADDHDSMLTVVNEYDPFA